MKYEELKVQGAFQVTLEPRGDERGWFTRLFCQQEFAEHGLDPRINQVNNSFSAQAGTLRGIHFQRGASAETKLVRAVTGGVYDVVVDLRPDSPTYRAWDAIEVTAANRAMLYVPRGCGHAIFTLTDDTELIYFASQAYDGAAEGGVRWNDPGLDISWPFAPVVLSDKDASWPDYAW